MESEWYGVTDAGSVRSENQDRILLEPALGLFAVCDGMGGHRNGGLAAEIAMAGIRHFLETSNDRLDVTWPFGYDFAWSVDANRLLTGIKLANRVVWRRAEEAIENAGMGTTVAALLLQADQVVVANVGDSRIYRLRGGHLDQLSVDDTMVASLVEKGLLTPEEIGKHPMRNILTQAAGSQEDVAVHVREEPLEEGDLFLICSDGLHGVVPDEKIYSLITSGGSMEQMARQLLDTALQSGSQDNVTVVVLRYHK